MPLALAASLYCGAAAAQMNEPVGDPVLEAALQAQAADAATATATDAPAGGTAKVADAAPALPRTAAFQPRYRPASVPARPAEDALGGAAPAAAGPQTAALPLWLAGRSQCRTPSTLHVWRWPAAGDDFARSRAQLMERAAGATLPERLAVMDRLAHLYFANALLPEARSYVGHAAGSEAAVRLSVAIASLRGDEPDTERLLALMEEGDADACLWAAVQTALNGGPVADESWLQAVATRIRAYPAWVETRLVPLLGEALLETGRVREARRFVPAAERLVETAEAADGALLQLFMGRVAQANGRSEEARAHYRLAAAGAGIGAAEARLRRIALDWREGRITAAMAAARLEPLRYDWRGDAVEAQTLIALARAYREAGRPLLAVEPLRLALENFPGTVFADTVTDELGEHLHAVLVTQAFGTPDPVTLVEAAERSLDMLPVGIVARDAISAYAQHLLALDLAPRAAQVMEYLFDRVSDKERDALALDLALMHLASGAPADALAALEGRKIDEPPLLSGADPRIVRAQALAQTGDVDSALSILKGFDGERRHERAMIAWQAQRWDVAAADFAVVKPAMDDRIALRRGLGRYLAEGTAPAETVASGWQDAILSGAAPSAPDFAPEEGAEMGPKELQEHVGSGDAIAGLLKTVKTQLLAEPPLQTVPLRRPDPSPALPVADGGRGPRVLAEAGGAPAQK